MDEAASLVVAVALVAARAEWAQRVMGVSAAEVRVVGSEVAAMEDVHARQRRAHSLGSYMDPGRDHQCWDGHMVAAL